MKVNRLFIVSAATVLLGGGTFIAIGQTWANPSLLIAQNSTPPGEAPQGGKGPRLEKFAEQLGLSDAQQTQLRQIHESSHQQLEAIPTAEQKTRMEVIRNQSKSRMDAVLTEQQRQQLQQAAPSANGQRKGPGFHRISGLTDAQRTQLRQIRTETRQQLATVLTDEQKAQMQTIRENAKRQMDAVLSEEQRQQLQQLRQQRRPQQSQQQPSGS